ncbi:hypothetical protein D3C80_2139020 [compost metagenome]
MGKQALLALGVDPKIVDEVMETFRERDVERFALECVGGIFAGRDLIIGNSKTQH